MSTDRQRFLHDLPTLVTPLRGKAGVHSNDLMSSTCSLGSEDIEKHASTGIKNGFRKVMVLDHIEDTQVFNDDPSIVQRILLGDLEMVISALLVDLQVRLGDITCGFPASITAFLPPAKCALLAPERLGRCAIETRVFNHVALAIGKKDLQPNVNTNVRMLTRTRHQHAFCCYCPDGAGQEPGSDGTR